MHLDTQSWASGPKHGATTANTRAMIDFAAKNGFGGVLVEGWNKGWDGDWFANGEDFSFTQPYADFDLPGLAAYGKSKGVVLIGHHETSANAAHYEEQMRAAFDLDQRLGIDSVKTGYVSDAGGFKAKTGPDGAIRYEWHEGQAASVHHLLVVTEAAKRHVAIDTHEPIKDTGLRRCVGERGGSRQRCLRKQSNTPYSHFTKHHSLDADVHASACPAALRSQMRASFTIASSIIDIHRATSDSDFSESSNLAKCT
eukprot:gene15398-20403_t